MKSTPSKYFLSAALMFLVMEMNAQIDVVAISGQVSPGSPGVFSGTTEQQYYRILDFSDDGRVAFSAPLIATENFPSDFIGSYIYDSGELGLAAQYGSERFDSFSDIEFYKNGYIITGVNDRQATMWINSGGEFSSIFPGDKSDEINLVEVTALGLGLSDVRASESGFIFRGTQRIDGRNKVDMFAWEGEGASTGISPLKLIDDVSNFSTDFDINDNGDVYSYSLFSGHSILNGGNVYSFGKYFDATPDGLGTFAGYTETSAIMNERGEIVFEAEVLEADGQYTRYFLADKTGNIRQIFTDEGVLLEDGRRFAAMTDLGSPLIDNSGRWILSGAIGNVGTQEVSYAIIRFNTDGTIDSVLDFSNYSDFDESVTFASNGSIRINHSFVGVYSSGNGDLAFSWVDSRGDPLALYAYNFDQDSLKKVVSVGGTQIDGSIAADINIYSTDSFASGDTLRSYINGVGEIVFQFQLEDERVGIALWSPGNVQALPKKAKTSGVEIVGEEAFVDSPNDFEAVSGSRIFLRATPVVDTDEVQWRKDGVVLEGRRGRVLVIEEASNSDVGRYESFYEVGDTTYVSEASSVTIDSESSTELINISTRGYVDFGARVLIGGFVIKGDVPMTVLVRAAGPSLVNAGLSEDLLENPQLGIYSGNTELKTNDDWGSGEFIEAELSTLFDSVGAFAWNESSKDAALVITLEPGIYTSIVSNAGGASGVGLVEVYQLSSGTVGD
ncbi:hypothetical protein MLD52_22380 [Puniceicoccaceae bacterium K14]|nr:hypothetical protein [Puniceicoccaceae bacterium K14]